MANYPLLGLDMDGVILDHTAAKLELARAQGYRLTKKETASDIFNTIVDEATKRIVWDALYYDPKTALRAPLLRGVREGLAALTRRKASFVLISRRRNTAMAREVLKKRKLWGAYFSDQNSFFVEEKKDKDAKARELGVSWYVDDQPSVLRELASVKRHFLMDPLGAHRPSRAYVKVSSWPEFLRALRAS